MKFAALLSLLSSSLAATNITEDQFQKLYDALFQEMSRNPVKIPALVRASFHDLNQFDGNQNGGPQGCLLQKPVQNMVSNAGVKQPVQQLAQFVAKKFPGVPFSAGDVISLAGKVGVEVSYPCIRIDWSGGRSQCSNTNPTDSSPSGAINKVADLNPFLKRYGLSLKEMGILLAGCHGLKFAGLRLTTINTKFPNTLIPAFNGQNSGPKWIKLSQGPFISTPALGNAGTKFHIPQAFVPRAITTIFAGTQSGVRLPIDMLFFPSTVKKTTGANLFADPAALGVEASLKRLDENSFNAKFEAAMTKMLKIGTSDLGSPIQNRARGVCKR